MFSIITILAEQVAKQGGNLSVHISTNITDSWQLFCYNFRVYLFRGKSSQEGQNILCTSALVEIVDKAKVLDIGSGLKDWLICVSNVGTRRVINGKSIKSLNPWYKEPSTIPNNGKPYEFGSIN